MAPQSIETRVKRLEHRVTGLEEVPARLDRLESLIVQLRIEMRDECSALREAGLAREDRVVATLQEEIRSTNERTVATLQGEIRSTNERTVAMLQEEIRSTNERTVAMLQEEIRSTDERTVAMLQEEIRSTNERTVATLRDEIRAGDEETRRFMRVLHEKVISDIATLGEVRQPPGRPRSGKKPRP